MGRGVPQQEQTRIYFQEIRKQLQGECYCLLRNLGINLRTNLKIDCEMYAFIILDQVKEIPNDLGVKKWISVFVKRYTVFFFRLLDVSFIENTLALKI